MTVISMKKLRIFVDFRPSADCLSLLEEGTSGHELLFAANPVTSVLHKAEVDPLLLTSDVAFGQPDVDAVKEATRLQWIQVSTSGITRYDNQPFHTLMKERGVMVSNSASVYAEACAVQTMAYILAQSRLLPEALASQAPNGSPAWTQLRDSLIPLRGQTFLIYGYGSIGRRLAAFLQPFGARVLAYRRHPRGDEGVPVVSDEQLSGVLAREVDHVINILPDSAATRNYFDAGRFAALKPRTVFYNIGRGSTVDQGALEASLRSSHLAAAWLDVTEPEPLPADHSLRQAPNCHITPHIAGGHANELRTLVGHFLDNLRRFEKDEPLLDRVM